MTKDLKELHRALFYNFLEGVEFEVIERLANKYVSEALKDMLYLPALERLKNAQAQNDHTIILSATPCFIVKPIAKYLNVTNYFATDYVVENKKLKDLRRVLDSEGKLEKLCEIQKALGVNQENLITFSDSYKDLCFLKASNTPVAVNPDRKLRLACKKLNWEII